MNEVFLPHDGADPLERFRLADFEVSWAGPNPRAEGFCLGSEDGQLRFTDTQLTYLGDMKGVSVSGEAVNGVAHFQNWTAVTTRAEVNLIGPRTQENGPHEAIVIPVGAFGVEVAQLDISWCHSAAVGSCISSQAPGRRNPCRSAAQSKRA